MALLGELWGTCSLLVLGLSSGLLLVDYPTNHLKPWLVAGCWGIAIFLANLVGLAMGSNRLNPIFSLLAWAAGQISLSYFLLELACQIIGASLGMLIILGLFKKPLAASSQGLELLTTVPQSTKLPLNIAAEFSGTFILVFVSLLLSTWQLPKVLAASLIAILLWGLIMVVAPITGASFNPVRDLIPRLFFALFLNEEDRAVWSLGWITTLIPVLGGLAGAWAHGLLIS